MHGTMNVKYKDTCERHKMRNKTKIIQSNSSVCTEMIQKIRRDEIQMTPNTTRMKTINVHIFFFHAVIKLLKDESKNYYQTLLYSTRDQCEPGSPIFLV
jgi:hypothetical protein